MFVDTDFESFTLTLLLTDLLSTTVLLTFKLLLLLTLVLFTVLVLVEALFVSTRVFESYVVCDKTDIEDITKSEPRMNFFILLPFVEMGLLTYLGSYSMLAL